MRNEGISCNRSGPTVQTLSDQNTLDRLLLPEPVIDLIRRALPRPAQYGSSRDCSESVAARRSKPVTGSLSGLPDRGVRIVSADDGEEPVALAGLSGLLPRKHEGKTRILV